MRRNQLLIIGCSKRKIATNDAKVRAIDLYIGGVFPEFKKYFELSPEFLNSVFILSGKYGLINSQDLIETYDYRLEYKKSLHLIEDVHSKLSEIIWERKIDTILLICEPDYFVLVSKLFSLDEKPNILWEPNMDYLSDWALNKINSLFPNDCKSIDINQ